MVAATALKAAAMEASTATTAVRTAAPTAVAATSTLGKSLSGQEKQRSRCDECEKSLERGGFLHLEFPPKCGAALGKRDPLLKS